MEMNVEKNLDEDFKVTISSKNYDRSKIGGECGIYYIFRSHDNK